MLSLHTGRTTPVIHCGCAGAAVLFRFWHCPPPNVLSLHQPQLYPAHDARQVALSLKVEHLSTPEMVLLGKHQPSGLPPGVCGCHAVGPQPVLLAGPNMLPVRQLPPLPLASGRTQRKAQGKNNRARERWKAGPLTTEHAARRPSL